MEWQQVQSDWKASSARLQKQWPNLTAADLDAVSGDRQKLLGKLTQRHGYHVNDAEKQLTAFLAGAAPEQPHPVATMAPANPASSMPAAPPDSVTPAKPGQHS